MTRLEYIPVALLTLFLAGCGQESDTLPLDGRDFDGVSYAEPAPYTGKVIDGYLVNARVWLDMDGDSQYTPGPLEIELENGNVAVLESGEPTAMSGQGGEFSLDVGELALSPAIGPDLDPRNYPFYAVALPGKTLEQTWRGDVPVARAFLMSAAPGVRNITPLTTLARYRRLFGLGSYLDTPEDLSGSLAGLNLVADYVLSGDERAHAYARALARFMASQIPDDYNEALSRPDSDGTERSLRNPEQAAYLFGLSLVQNAPSVIALVDEAAGGDYANVDPDALTLPVVPLELSDPVLLTHQRILAQPENDQNLPASTSSLLASAELFFDFSEAGQLLSVSAEGCLAPSMPELVRLINVNGLMYRLGSQWRPSVSLSPQSRIAYEVEGVDERLIFDWNGQRIYFETSTTCHEHEGILAGSTELSGNPEVIFRWQKVGDAVAELVAEIPQSDGSILIRRLEPQPEPEVAPDDFGGFTLVENGSQIASLELGGTEAACDELLAAEAEVAALDHVVTDQYGYAFTGYDPQPANFVNLALEYDTRDLDGDGAGAPVSRLLRYGFLDPDLSGLANVDAGTGFQWAMYYPTTFDPANPNLIREAYLTSYSGARECKREFEETPSSAYAKVEYSYQVLSEYLLGLLD
ncbi:hypothetical protein MD273_14935 [Marinobacter pelagius]|uniref:hypothetical protein n=1 Tax=Marinobacter sp. C7 TaxID=2951363 RepID=UPI001EF0FCB9|nr:hypothetical protein [Marinobacter sp. C7]MCG7201028.1 hypothetical protein [Marinobacter sp. C7]